MNWIYWILLIVILLIILRKYLAKPYYHKNKKISDFRSFIKSLISQMTDGSIIYFDKKESDGFLQIALTEYSVSDIKIECGIPEIDWSQKYFEDILTFVEEQAFEHLLEVNENEKVTRFLRVFINAPEDDIVDKTYNFLAKVANILNWTENELFTIHFDGQINKRVFMKNLEYLKEAPDNFFTRKLRNYWNRQINKK